MKGVTFGDVHTDDFGIYLSSVTINEPKVREYSIEIPGASGSLDLTEFFGTPLYDNRKLTFELTFPQKNSELLKNYSDFVRAVHGKKMDIVLDDDPDFYYSGRVSVGKLKKNTISKVTVECECDPYKYSSTRNRIEIVVDDVEFLPDWVYGDINGDGVVNQKDLTAVTALLGRRSYESSAAMHADFDFDGIVSEDDMNALTSYLKTSQANSFKDYIIMSPALLTPKYCKRQVIDFGDIPVDVTFSAKEITGTKLWEVRIDNIPLAESIHGYKSYSERLFGVHEIMIVTANQNTTGTFEVKWNGGGVL